MKLRPPDASLAASSALRVLAFCAARGHDREVLAREVGLSVAALAAPEARIPYATMATLGERALLITGDDTFGLHLAMDVGDPAKLDNGVLLLMACPSVRVAIDKMVVYQRYWGDGERARLFPVSGGGRSALRVAPSRGRVRAARGRVRAG